MALLHRCIDGRTLNALLADQAMLRDQTSTHRAAMITPETRATANLAAARQHGLIAPRLEP